MYNDEVILLMWSMGNNMEQMELGLVPKEAPDHQPLDVHTAAHEEIIATLEAMNRLELGLAYKRFVRIDPTFRELSDEELRTGIKDPATERNRLALIDQKEDQETRRNYGKN